MKVSDAAPDEALLVELSERLNTALSGKGALNAKPMLDLDAAFLQAARNLLATLSDRVDGSAGAFHGSIPQSQEQIETYLDFNPDFLDQARQMLADFIKRTEIHRSRHAVLSTLDPDVRKGAARSD
jgi:hypothetical protein